jgi:hypothetical protein
MDAAVESLVSEAWRIYNRAGDNPCVVRPSIPILYFGDRDAYLRSPLKVITVGLNPSRCEFPEGDRFARFRQAEHVCPGVLHGRFYEEYLAALNEYFHLMPYRRWFNAFEPLLNGMEGSYYAGQASTAMHTDLCSPLATDPTWGGLTPKEQGKLRPDGVKLWLQLADYFAPDVILISVAQRHLQELPAPPLTEWETIHTVNRANPYLVRATEVEIVPGKRTTIVFGRAARVPFALVSAAEKREIGQRIADRFYGR